MASAARQFNQRQPVPAVYPEIAAFADTLDDTHEMYWPALAASDGCEASLRELNEMLVADGREPFVARRAAA